MDNSSHSHLKKTKIIEQLNEILYELLNPDCEISSNNIDDIKLYLYDLNKQINLIAKSIDTDIMVNIFNEYYIIKNRTMVNNVIFFIKNEITILKQAKKFDEIILKQYLKDFDKRLSFLVKELNV